ncbi:MAG TPA: hypothetical protein VGK24_09585 [Candidatus Angelobacter sp.]|jgi:hypothetical protein
MIPYSSSYYNESRRWREYLEWKREERRKFDMMEAWYEQQRMDARGRLRPETANEAVFKAYMIPLEIIR